MDRRIDQLYGLPKYESILYYLKANDILTIANLRGFDFQELLFVPGVSPALAEEAKYLYEESLSDIDSDATVCKPQSNITEAPCSICNKEEEDSIEYKSVLPSTKISDIYAGVPRSSLFINWCAYHGKLFMHDLCDQDFEAAKMIKGLGAPSVERLKKIYKSFFSAEQPTSLEYNNDLESAEISANTPIETIFKALPHGSSFCSHCRSIGLLTLSDLRDFSFDHEAIKGIGPNSMKQIQQVYLNAITQIDISPLTASDFLDIPAINYGIPIPHQVLIEESYKCIGDICKNGLPFPLFVQIQNWLNTYKKSIIDIFADEVIDLPENVRYCLTMRAGGQTLQQIADHIGITRERVRQIVAKAMRKLIHNISDIADSMLYPDKLFFAFDDLIQAFQDSPLAEVYRSIVKNADESSQVIYLDFADKFLKASFDKQEYEVRLREIAEDEIGDGINFFDNLEQIEAQLKAKNIPALDFEDFMNFLVKHNYHFYGDYVMRGRQSYAIVCADAVRKFFPQGIKLNSDENNEDLAHLRMIISKYYGGLELPENNRALSARMITALIQSGKSQYCHIDSVIYSIGLFDEIYDHMQHSLQPSFHYSELYELFKGRLLSETNITNYHFLHGMLKYLFAEDFEFNDRDIITKCGETKQNADFRLNELLLNSGTPLSKKEIKTAFPGINDFVIAFSVNREERIIPWDYNIYNHIDNLNVNNEDISRMTYILDQAVKEHNGYLSDSLLFDTVKTKFPQFLDENIIENERNLYYVIAYYFRDLYRFRKPHILTLDIDIGDLSLINIAKYLLDCQNGINYKEYLNLASKLGWANGTLYSVFSDLETEFIRISEDDYVTKDMFIFENNFIERFNEQITILLKDSGYFSLFSLFSFQGFPQCQFEWNGFLVESIIRECNTEYKILSPQVKDRRYQRGIIVNKNNPVHSFEELVSQIMKTDGDISLSEPEFCDYLKQKGLIYNTIPQELYNCDEIIFKTEMFSIGKN